MQKIKYPTGGETEFIYELHSVYETNYEELYSENIELSGSPEISEKFSLPFTLDDQTYVTITNDGETDGLDFMAEIQKLNTGIGQFQSYTPTYAGGLGNRSVFDMGTYRLHIINNTATTRTIKVEYEKNVNKNVPIGGLRINRMNFLDPLKGNNTTKLFFYNKQNSTESSGKLFTQIDMGGNLSYYMGGVPSSNCISTPPSTFINLSSYSQAPLAIYEGAHVGYSEVEVIDYPYGTQGGHPFIQDEDLLRGKTRYSFVNDVASSMGFPYVPQTDLTHKNGKLLKEEQFVLNDQNTLYLKYENENEYEEYNETNGIMGANLKVETSRFCGTCHEGVVSNSDYVYNLYHLKSNWFYKVSETKREYNEIGDIIYQDQTAYDYLPFSGIHHKFVSRSKILSNNTVQIETVVRLPYRSSLIGEYERLIDGEQVEGIHQTYQNNLPLVQSRWNRDLDTYEPIKNFTYNEENYLIDVNDLRNLQTSSFLYNEDNQIRAKINNYDYTQLNDNLTKNDLYTLGGNARINYFEYDDKLNLSKITDANQKELSYLYDDFNRLTKATELYNGNNVTISDAQYSLTGRTSSPAGLNSIITREAIHPISGTLENTGAEYINEKTDYFDGLGRPIQEILVENTPISNGSYGDLIQPIGYDEYGRQRIEYLPYMEISNGGMFHTAANQELMDFYNTENDFHATSQFPYSQIIYEKSPKDRPIEKGAQGESMQPGMGHTTRMTYTYNGTNEVILWTMGNDNHIVKSGFFNSAPATLTKKIIIDQNGYFLEEFKNKRDQVVLKNVESSEGIAQTYYLYDEFDNLIDVLTPDLVNQIENLSIGQSISQELLDKFGFQYKYDGRNRQIEKKVPGAMWVEMLYDEKDRLVLMQDGNQRNNKNNWSYTKYDVFNRPVSTGIIDMGTKSRNDMEIELAGVSSLDEEFDASKSFGYTDQAYPTEQDGNIQEYLSFTYYDNYLNRNLSYLSPNSFDYGINEISDVDVQLPDAIEHYGLPDNSNTKVKDQTTATLIKVLGSQNWVKTLNYYDDKYRLIQSITYNDFNQSNDRLSINYNYIGWILTSLVEHSYSNSPNLSIRKEFEYDQAGRLTKSWHEIINNSISNGKILTSDNRYNKLGILMEKNLHVIEQNNFVPRQSVDYSYTIQGWLKSINDPILDNPTEDISDYFGMQLYYDNTLNP